MVGNCFVDSDAKQAGAEGVRARAIQHEFRSSVRPFDRFVDP